MKTSDFDYHLPTELIAQTPIVNRDKSRLLIVDRYSAALTDDYFFNLKKYLKPGDVLVLNDTKVLPARLIGEKEGTKAVIELLLLQEMGNDTWECLAKPVKRLKIGTIIKFGDQLTGEVLTIKEEGIVIIKFTYLGIFLEILNKLGEMPLPPYIHEKLADKNRYQTIYAKCVGSAAAPTAGLHFTNELLNGLKNYGVIITYLTLHVGLGTFRPVNVEDVTKHQMHQEYYSMNTETAEILNKAKKEKRSIIAVGTTSVRTLETIYQLNNQFIANSGYTNIFIYPGFKYQAINGLITNFHLPKSTLLMLVSAFASKDIIFNAYQHAIDHKYRFFSFGDAMLIINRGEKDEI